MNGMPARLFQHQPRQGGAGSRCQPPDVVVGPAERCQLRPALLDDQPAALGTSQAATAFGNAVPAWVPGLPGLPEAGFMAGAVAAETEPVQFHAQSSQVLYRRCFLGVATQQAGGGEAEALAGGRQGMEMVGMVAAQAYQARGIGRAGLEQVMTQLEPFVAADQWVDQVQAQDRGVDSRVA
ncbi:hypothetical protein A9L43_03630 [Pseudomonas mosselii]|nr:hypothetical protein A9L43_03630 [Pseudomonas mosselii]